MIEYIVTTNPDTRLIKRAANLLNDGGLVAIPTDTSWAITASIASREGRERLLNLMPEERQRSPTFICADIQQTAEYCELSDAAFRFIKPIVPGPFVFILKSTNKVAKLFSLKRAEIGVRIPRHSIPHAIIAELGYPLLSITARRTMVDKSAEKPEYPEAELFDGAWELEDIQGLALIIAGEEDCEKKITTVIDLRAGDPVLIRQGAGEVP
jgi:tRNA threonylcarbamoyl adenosine modification protein (Sua5/YciO/YrdC/YwlC family)